jgi:hypothetical protein
MNCIIRRAHHMAAEDEIAIWRRLGLRRIGHSRESQIDAVRIAWHKPSDYGRSLKLARRQNTAFKCSKERFAASGSGGDAQRYLNDQVIGRLFSRSALV